MKVILCVMAYCMGGYGVRSILDWLIGSEPAE